MTTPMNPTLAQAAERWNDLLVDEPFRPYAPPGDGAAWDELAAMSGAAQVLERAQQAVSQPLEPWTKAGYLLFSETGDRQTFERVLFGRRKRLALLALAESMERQGRFAQALARTALDLADQRCWCLPAHDRTLADFHGETPSLDLVATDLAFELAWIRLHVADVLSQGVRDQILQRLHERMIDPLLAMLRGELEPEWWFHGVNNWNAVCHEGVAGMVACLPSLPRADRALVLAAAETHIRPFLEGFEPEGYCSEGVGYWNYGFGCFLSLCEILLQQSGGAVDLFQLPQVRPAARTVFGLHLGGGIYPTFSDVHPGTQPAAWMSRWLGQGDRAADPSVPASPLSAHGWLMTLRAPLRMVLDPVGEEPHTWLPQAQVYVGRPAREGDLALAAKGGHNAEMHNQNDVGSWCLALDGVMVLGDLGSETYRASTFDGRRYESDANNSFGHPVPLVDGCMQSSGRAAAGAVVETAWDGDRDRLVFELAGAYAVAGLRSLRRTFEYHRDGRVIVTDELHADRPMSWETALTTFGRAEPTADGWIVEHDGRRVRVRVATNEGQEPGLRQQELSADYHGRRGWRLAASLPQEKEHAARPRRLRMEVGPA